jgi:hypothetical protein
MFIKWIFNFILVTITWIFFRAQNLSNAKQIIENIFTAKKGSLFIGNAAYFVYSVVLILFLLLADYNTEKFDHRYSLIYHKNKVYRWVGYCILIIAILLVGVFNGGQFIYFQF